MHSSISTRQRKATSRRENDNVDNVDRLGNRGRGIKDAPMRDDAQELGHARRFPDNKRRRQALTGIYSVPDLQPLSCHARQL